MLAELPAQDLAATAAAREQTHRLDAELRRPPQADIPTEHTFGPGFYARTIRVPAGTVRTGKVHANEHLFIVSERRIALATEAGGQIAAGSARRNAFGDLLKTASVAAGFF